MIPSLCGSGIFVLSYLKKKKKFLMENMSNVAVSWTTVQALCALKSMLRKRVFSFYNKVAKVGRTEGTVRFWRREAKLKVHLSKLLGCQHFHCARWELPALRSWSSPKSLCPSPVPSTFSLVCHSAPTLALLGILKRVSIIFFLLLKGD